MGHGDLAALARLLHDGGTKLGAELHQLAVLAVDPHFDEVSAIGDDLIHFGASLFRRLRLRAGDKGGGHEAVLYGENPRAAEIAALLLRLEIADVVGIEAHVGRGGDAIEGVLSQLGVALRVHVAVGVDDARQDELAGEIHNGCASRSRNFGRRPNVADVAVLHHDGDVVLRTRTGAVNDRGMRESGDLRRGAHGKKQGRRQNNNSA